MIFTVGLENAADSSPLRISSYTLDLSFDATELAFVRAEQLVPFASGTVGFTPPNDCAGARCTLVPRLLIVDAVEKGVEGLQPYVRFSRSRISVNSFSSAVGPGAAGAGAGFRIAFTPFTSRNTQNAMMMKSIEVWMKLP